MQKLVEKRTNSLKNYKKTVGPKSVKISDVHTGTWRNNRPVIDFDKCIMCGICVDYCPCGVVKKNEQINIDYQYCKGCGVCVNECPKNAIDFPLEKDLEEE